MSAPQNLFTITQNAIHCGKKKKKSFFLDIL